MVGDSVDMQSNGHAGLVSAFGLDLVSSSCSSQCAGGGVDEAVRSTVVGALGDVSKMCSFSTAAPKDQDRACQTRRHGTAQNRARSQGLFDTLPLPQLVNMLHAYGVKRNKAWKFSFLTPSQP